MSLEDQAKKMVPEAEASVKALEDEVCELMSKLAKAKQALMRAKEVRSAMYRAAGVLEPHGGHIREGSMIEDIYRLVSEKPGLTARQIAEELDYNPMTVSGHLCSKRWTHVFKRHPGRPATWTILDGEKPYLRG